MKVLMDKLSVWRLFYAIREHSGLWCSRLVFLLGPWMALWMVETLNENDVLEDLYLWQIGMNLIWYYMLFFLRWD